ncbi:MAG: hypothetical protein WC052_02885 [Patescibacteria group bacterium]
MYTHFKCFELCKNNFGRYLSVAGNIGIFCHFENEYEFLTKLRKELTEESNNWNQKYYRLLEPIFIPTNGDIPETVYTYLYIRKPDEHTEVGDVDFILGVEEFNELKNSLQSGKEMKGIRLFSRPDLDLIRLFDASTDVLAFIGKKNMAENIL